MATRAEIDGFLAQPRLAIIGVSRTPGKFGNAVLRTLRRQGRTVVPVHRDAEQIEGLPCAATLGAISDPVGGVVLIVSRRHVLPALREVAEAGIRRVWIQQGSDTPEALRFCEQNGIHAIHGQCILLFAEPVVSIHRFHRLISALFGRMPA